MVAKRHNDTDERRERRRRRKRTTHMCGSMRVKKLDGLSVKVIHASHGPILGPKTGLFVLSEASHQSCRPVMRTRGCQPRLAPGSDKSASWVGGHSQDLPMDRSKNSTLRANRPCKEGHASTPVQLTHHFQNYFWVSLPNHGDLVLCWSRACPRNFFLPIALPSDACLPGAIPYSSFPCLSRLR